MLSQRQFLSASSTLKSIFLKSLIHFIYRNLKTIVLNLLHDAVVEKSSLILPENTVPLLCLAWEFKQT